MTSNTSLSIGSVIIATAFFIGIGCTPVVLMLGAYSIFLGRLKERGEAAMIAERKQAYAVLPSVPSEPPGFLIRP